MSNLNIEVTVQYNCLLVLVDNLGSELVQELEYVLVCFDSWEDKFSW